MLTLENVFLNSFIYTQFQKYEIISSSSKEIQADMILLFHYVIV